MLRMGEDKRAYLLDVVEVDHDKRVRCQAQGCGHSVYARIHVILVDGQFQVLGGSCFQRLYGRVLEGAKSYYGGSIGSPTRLDDEMRLLLASNTAEFIERLEVKRLEFEANAALKRPLVQNEVDRPAEHQHIPPEMPRVGGATPGHENETGQVAPSAPRFVYVFDDPSAAPYEGRAVLRWQWLQDKASIASRLAAYKANPLPGSDQDVLVRCYEKFQRETPYLFVLMVEQIHFMPKKTCPTCASPIGADRAKLVAPLSVPQVASTIVFTTLVLKLFLMCWHHHTPTSQIRP